MKLVLFISGVIVCLFLDNGAEGVPLNDKRKDEMVLYGNQQNEAHLSVKKSGPHQPLASFADSTGSDVEQELQQMERQNKPVVTEQIAPLNSAPQLPSRHAVVESKPVHEHKEEDALEAELPSESLENEAPKQHHESNHKSPPSQESMQKLLNKYVDAEEELDSEAKYHQQAVRTTQIKRLHHDRMFNKMKSFEIKRFKAHIPSEEEQLSALRDLKQSVKRHESHSASDRPEHVHKGRAYDGGDATKESHHTHKGHSKHHSRHAEDEIAAELNHEAVDKRESAKKRAIDDRNAISSLQEAKKELIRRSRETSMAGSTLARKKRAVNEPDPETLEELERYMEANNMGYGSEEETPSYYPPAAAEEIFGPVFHQAMKEESQINPQAIEDIEDAFEEREGPTVLYAEIIHEGVPGYFIPVDQEGASAIMESLENQELNEEMNEIQELARELGDREIEKKNYDVYQYVPDFPIVEQRQEYFPSEELYKKK